MAKSAIDRTAAYMVAVYRVAEAVKLRMDIIENGIEECRRKGREEMRKRRSGKTEWQWERPNKKGEEA